MSLPTHPSSFLFFFHHPPTTEIYTLSLHDALPISGAGENDDPRVFVVLDLGELLIQLAGERSEEHTSELQSLRHLVCRLLLEKKKNMELRIIENNIRIFINVEEQRE